MKRLVMPLLAAAGVLTFSGVATGQREGDARSRMSGMSQELVASANCNQPKITKEKITEDQARDLAQQYADKNLAGFKVVRPLGYGGGYQTVCYKTESPMTLSVLPEAALIFASFPAASSAAFPTVMAGLRPVTGRSQAFYSVEYSIDAKNSAAETRNVRVDQFGSVTEFSSILSVAGERDQ